jgi:hypothetical protein
MPPGAPMRGCTGWRCAHVDIAKDIAPFRLMEAINARIRPNPVVWTA